MSDAPKAWLSRASERRLRPRSPRRATTRNTRLVGADEGSDPLAWIDPTRADFFKECAGVARDLVERHGNGKWAASAQGLLTAAIMQQALYAARENRTPSLIDVARGLSGACRTIRRRTRFHSHQETNL